MKVEEPTAVADVAASRPATSPAAGPPIARPSHQVTPTAAIPKSAIRKTTAVGSVPPAGIAAGARR
jgi:hypothetical protein